MEDHGADQRDDILAEPDLARFFTEIGNENEPLLSLAERTQIIFEKTDPEALIRLMRATDLNEEGVYDKWPTQEELPFDPLTESRSFLCPDGRKAQTRVSPSGKMSIVPKLLRQAKNVGDEEIYSLTLPCSRCETCSVIFRTTKCAGHMVSKVQKVLILSTVQHEGWVKLDTTRTDLILYRRPKGRPVLWQQESPKPYVNIQRRKKENKEVGEEHGNVQGEERGVMQEEQGESQGMVRGQEENVASGSMGPPQNVGTPLQIAGTPPQDGGTPLQIAGTPPQNVASGSTRPLQNVGTPLQIAGTPLQGTPLQIAGTPPQNIASGSRRPLQHVLADLVTAIIKNNRNDGDDGFYRIVESLGASSSDRVDALLGVPEVDPGLLKKGEVEVKTGRGLIHILVAPTEHIGAHSEDTDWTFGSEVATSRIEMLTDLQSLVGEDGFKKLMMQAKRNKAIGLHTLTKYMKKDVDAEDKEESKEAHMLDLLKAVLKMSDLDALTHPSHHNFLPIHNAARNGSSTAVTLIADRIRELMVNCSDSEVQTTLFQLGNKHYVRNNGPETLEKGMPSGWTPLPHDEEGGNLNVANLCKMLTNLKWREEDTKRPREV